MGHKERTDNQSGIEELRELLRSTGMRATPARIAVLKAVRESRSPLTHATLTERLVPAGFDKATIFRNLTDLTEVGLLSRTELGDHVWRFEASDPNRPENNRHPHFVCEDCGEVTCLEEMEFTSRSKKRSGSIGKISEILIKGQCTECISE